MPARIGQQRVRQRQSLDAALHRSDIVVDALGARQSNDRLDDGERIAGAMIDLSRQQHLPFFGLLALGNVDGDAADPHHVAGCVDTRRGRAGAPAQLAIGAAHAEFDLLGAFALGHAPDHLPQRLPVIGVHKVADVVRRDLKILGLDAEDAVLALVPRPAIGRDVPFPRAHLARRQRQAAALLALQ